MDKTDYALAWGLAQLITAGKLKKEVTPSGLRLLADAVLAGEPPSPVALAAMGAMAKALRKHSR